MDLYERFRQPSPEFTAVPFWFWNGKMEPEEITRQLELMHEQHIYQCVIHARYGLVTPYFSEDWFACIAHAIREGKRLGYRIFCIYGAIGGRLDHTVANIQLIAALAQEGKRGYLLGGGQAVTVLAESQLYFAPRGGGYFSAFAFGAAAAGVYEQGLKYTLSDARLEVSFPLGVSNEFCGQEAHVSVREGKLLLIWDQDALEFNPRGQLL